MPHSRPPTLESLLAQDFVNDSCVRYHSVKLESLLRLLCSHIKAFAHALQLDESYFDTHGDTSSPRTPGSPALSSGGTRIRKVSALSDFAPINLKVTKLVTLKDY
jgi:hypothetical protein